MTASEPLVVVVDTMVASALVNARFDPTRAEPFRKVIGERRIIISFATATELRFGAIKAGWGQLRMRGLSRDMERFRVVQPDDDLMRRCARLRVDYERAGHPLAQKIHDADRWIATTALAQLGPRLGRQGVQECSRPVAAVDPPLTLAS